MEQVTQDRAREELIKQYEVWAFEALANYRFYGERLKPIEKGIADAEKIVADCTTKISLIDASSDHHTKENRERKTLLRKDIEMYEKRIKEMRALGEKSEKEVIAWRERGVTYLEQIENFKVFKVATPQEIEAQKNKPLENNQEIKS